MSESDNIIRQLASELHQEQAARQEQALTAREVGMRQEAASKAAGVEGARQHREELVDLCSKFAVWGSRHDIPYNSPSVLARGWLLGRGDIGGSVTFSGYGVSSQMDSHGSLLVSRGGVIKELVTQDAARANGGAKRRYQLLPHKPEFGAFSIESVLRSIAVFSSESKIPW